MKSRAVLFILLLPIFFIIPGCVYKPVFEGWDSTFEKPVIVPEHRISCAVYGELKTKDDIDFIKFSAKSGDTFYVQMTVPIIKGYEDFKPYIAVIGRGINERDEVPFKVPDDYGVIVLPPGPADYFYEKFTQTSYYQGRSIRGEIPSDGNYYIAVFSQNTGGKYTLVVGEKEKFGIIDIIRFPYTYARVKYFFSPPATIFIFAGVILIITAAVKYIKFRR